MNSDLSGPEIGEGGGMVQNARAQAPPDLPRICLEGDQGKFSSLVLGMGRRFSNGTNGREGSREWSTEGGGRGKRVENQKTKADNTRTVSFLPAKKGKKRVRTPCWKPWGGEQKKEKRRGCGSNRDGGDPWGRKESILS